MYFNDPFGLSPDANKKLAKCYANALIAYRQGKSQHNWVTWGAKKVSPFASIGAIVSGARGFVNPTSKLPVTTQHLWGNTLVSRYAPLINWGIRLRGAVGGALRTSGNPAARVLGLAAIGGALVTEASDQALGTEAFLRQAIAECNVGNSCATNKVESGALTIIGGFFGIAFSDSVQKYIDNNE